MKKEKNEDVEEKSGQKEKERKKGKSIKNEAESKEDEIVRVFFS